MNVFDRRTKGLQRERAANLENNIDFDYLKEEFGYRLADRVLDIKVYNDFFLKFSLKIAFHFKDHMTFFLKYTFNLFRLKKEI